MFGKKRETNIGIPKGKSAAAAKIVLVVAVLAILAGNSYYSIQEEEQAVVCTFGSPKAGKNEIQSNIKQMILDKLESYDIGIQLVNITIQDATPPTAEVENAFKEVETAKQGKETALNNANKYRNEQIPNAEAESDKILQDAEAKKQERINEANGQAARFNSMYQEYAKYPEVTKKRMFYEAIEDVLPDVKVVFEGEGGKTTTMLPLDSFVTQESSSINENGSTLEDGTAETQEEE